MTTMSLYDAHSRLYDGLPDGIVINVCERGPDDARVVGGDLIALAHALGLNDEDCAAAAEGDTFAIDHELCRRWRVLVAQVSE